MGVCLCGGPGGVSAWGGGDGAPRGGRGVGVPGRQRPDLVRGCGQRVDAELPVRVREAVRVRELPGSLAGHSLGRVRVSRRECGTARRRKHVKLRRQLRPPVHLVPPLGPPTVAFGSPVIDDASRALTLA